VVDGARLESVYTARYRGFESHRLRQKIESAMFYTVYKTVNQLNGHYYLGVHKTRRSNDQYLGSGIIIKRAIAKHGKGNFKKEVLFAFETAEAAFTKEQELLSACLNDPSCYNLHEGGNGGFGVVNATKLSRSKQHAQLATTTRMKKFYTDPKFAEEMRGYAIQGNKAFVQKFQTNPEFAVKIVEQARKTVKLAQAAWTGQRHTKASRQKMSEAKRGAKNNCFGLRWVQNDILQISKRVKIEELGQHLQQGWELGRKFYKR
jgi:hypothetical protein